MCDCVCKCVCVCARVCMCVCVRVHNSHGIEGVLTRSDPSKQQKIHTCDMRKFIHVCDMPHSHARPDSFVRVTRRTHILQRFCIDILQQFCTISARILSHTYIFMYTNPDCDSQCRERCNTSLFLSLSLSHTHTCTCTHAHTHIHIHVYESRLWQSMYEEM